MSESNSQEQFDYITNQYLENVTNTMNGSPELEIRFGTRGIKSISKIDFENVIKKLKSSGFAIMTTSDTLKIQTEFINKKGKTTDSNVRVEVNGIHNIQKYCNTNSLDDITSLKFNQKTTPQMEFNKRPLYKVDIDDYNLRISYQLEKEISSYSSFATNIKENWGENKKKFRLLNRISFAHPDYPVMIDLSIVKSNHTENIMYKGKKKSVLKPEYSFESADVLNSDEKYEIELEVINSSVGSGTEFDTIGKLMKSLKKCIITVLAGLQNTNYPVSFSEIKNVGTDYLKLIYGKEYKPNLWLNSMTFIGPNSKTLLIENIIPENDDINFANIRKNYTVTDKADGARKLLYINKSGKIYLIDTNLNIQFTGAITKIIELRETVLDGEHILHNKKGEFINLYAAFDVYIINKKDVRDNAFIPDEDSAESDILNKYRLPLLVNIVTNLQPVSVTSSGLSPIRIQHKNFKAENINTSIFQCCNTVLEQESSLEYDIDGLIFTPSNLGVGANKPQESGPKFKSTWDNSFKWKPPEFNTIDFLVTTKKDANNEDFIGNKFQDGTDTLSYDKISQYKTLILRVGFNEKEHGYINPCGDVINGKLPSVSYNRDNEKEYKPVPFHPSNPDDPEAYLCNVMLKDDLNQNKQMFSEEDNEMFTDNMIVEFKYDMTKEKGWRWIPIRVRYDKTEAYKKGKPVFGNAYHVANNNWKSIHNPVTASMLTSGKDIPDEIVNDEVYYNKITGKSETKGLRDFHNLFVKKMLITSIAKRNDILIDYAVGQGGDFTKWITAKLSFVFGIDISPDNIENRIRGACARYLNYKKEYKHMPSALFVIGNSEDNIKDGSAIDTERGKQITKAVFGEGPKDKEKLGMGVYKEYGVASDGFNISSCQFALHYFFQDRRTLNGFLRNLSECTKLNGYFIGGCYDGTKIFNSLKKINEGDSKTLITNSGTKIWEITKNYTNDEFEDDETSLGYIIDVYQETINKKFEEYLVNFNYLDRMMDNYGFAKLTQEECKEIGLIDSVGSFKQLYNIMEQDIKKNPKNKQLYGKAFNMTPKEKEISFYNNYFIYKKVRNIDSRAMYNSMVSSSKVQDKMEMIESKHAQEIAEEEEEKDLTIKPVKKIKRKLKLKEISKDSKE